MDTELIKGDLRIQLESIGEGFSGDYDEDDPDDLELLRFYVSRRAVTDEDRELTLTDWIDLDDCSYCTLLPYEMSRDMYTKALEYLMDKLYEPFVNGDDLDHICERLSWIQESWLVKVD